MFWFVITVFCSGWFGWFSIILTARDDDGIKLTELMLEILVENLNFDGLIGSYNCVYFSFTKISIEAPI